MFPIRRLFHGALALIAFAAAFPAAAFSAATTPDVTISGDLRLRWEKDWDSHTSSGSARTDRERARARARLNVLWKAS